MILTFDEVWNFLQSTFVDPKVLQVIDPKTGVRINPNVFIQDGWWEYRYNMNVLKELWDNCYTFIVHASCVTPRVRRLIESIEVQNNCWAQAHIYMGKMGSKSFPIHSDRPDNLIFQCVGSSKVTVYKQYAEYAALFPDADVDIEKEIILTPGNAVFIPSLRLHKFDPLEDRMSISVPMIPFGTPKN